MRRRSELVRRQKFSGHVLPHQRKNTTTKPKNVVRITGLEPARYHYHTDLNRACLPIPPYPHILLSISSAGKIVDKIVDRQRKGDETTMKNADYKAEKQGFLYKKLTTT